MFKYNKYNHNDNLVKNGNIKIGTLYYYRDMEQLRGISDPLEGSYVSTVSLENITTESLNSDPIKNQHFQFGANGNFFHLGESGSIGTFVSNLTQKSPNYLIFCFSDENSKEVMSEFDGADSCVEIFDRNFFTCITEHLQKNVHMSVTFQGAYLIDYDEYERPYNGDLLHPVVCKTKDFMGQKEIRAIWSCDPMFKLDDWYIFDIPELTKYCHFIEVES